MLARTLCFALTGVEGELVTVEAYCAGGGGAQVFAMAGLPDTAVRESRDRVSAALRNSGFAMPMGQTTVSLSPADLRKEGAAFDLSIAVALIFASRQAAARVQSEPLLVGELALDGRLVPVRGALAIALGAQAHGIRDIILPAGNAKELQAVQGLNVHPARSLSEAVAHLCGRDPIPAQEQVAYEALLSAQDIRCDLAQIRGQQGARRALEVAAAGGHNLLMVGVPGSGKTMLARCLPGILPQMTLDEAFETTRIHSVAGLLPPDAGLMTERPFRTPHHSASMPALVGGGSNAAPGEISLAHNGVLFLDELPEYPRSALEALRQPLEDGVATISRVRARTQYPSRCMLVASMNPCPCGFYGSRMKKCRCSEHEIRKYLARVSGPLLDRIDIQVEVDAVPVAEVASAPAAEGTRAVRERVQRARDRQAQRFAGTPYHCNAQLPASALDAFCLMTEEARKLLTLAMDRFGMSMRAYDRLRRVAQTIADLSGEETVTPACMAEAVQYRSMDGKYWS